MSKVAIVKLNQDTKEVWVTKVDIGYYERLKSEGWTVHLAPNSLEKICSYCDIAPTTSTLCSSCFRELEAEM